MKLTVVKFTRNITPYCVGDVATFSPEDAEKYLNPEADKNGKPVKPFATKVKEIDPAAEAKRAQEKKPANTKPAGNKTSPAKSKGGDKQSEPDTKPTE